MGWHPLELGQPGNVCMGYSTRTGGVSPAPWNSLNLGLNSGDDALRVAQNRRRLVSLAGVQPVWLQQVHGCDVACEPRSGYEADAACTHKAGKGLVVLTADCLPVLCWSEDGDWVGVAHAGWRGLAAGVLLALVEQAPVPPSRLGCWLGPCIGPDAFEVDAPVRKAFSAWPGTWAEHFRPNRPGHWLVDLSGLAHLQLQQMGVGRVLASGDCTYSQPERFFSYRRDQQTGRQASMIWLRDGLQT